MGPSLTGQILLLLLPLLGWMAPVQAASAVVTGGASLPATAVLSAEVATGVVAATASGLASTGASVLGAGVTGVGTAAAIAEVGGGCVGAAIGAGTTALPGTVAAVLTQAGLAGTAAGPAGWALLGATAVIGTIVVGASEHCNGDFDFNCDSVTRDIVTNSTYSTGMPLTDYSETNYGTMLRMDCWKRFVCVDTDCR